MGMFNLVEKELKRRENTSITENGAIGYKTSNSALLDLNYAISSLRQSDEEEIMFLFDKAFYENKEYALKWLFFARDIREGVGKDDCLEYVTKDYPIWISIHSIKT